jgi:hypothetical protein
LGFARGAGGFGDIFLKIGKLSAQENSTAKSSIDGLLET